MLSHLFLGDGFLHVPSGELFLSWFKSRLSALLLPVIFTIFQSFLGTPARRSASVVRVFKTNVRRPKLYVSTLMLEGFILPDLIALAKLLIVLIGPAPMFE